MKGCFTCAKENRSCPWDGTYHHRNAKGNVIQICNGYEELSGSILISIRPNWTLPIREQKKKWEIRKTKPNLKPPFKCYIYETLGKRIRLSSLFYENEGCGKVIGEFICDKIVEVGYSPYPNHGTYICEVENIHEESCVDFEDMFDYIADGYGYAWHISGLVIYDQPRDLNGFFYACKNPKCTDCSVCLDRRENRCKEIKRAPQSWCYCLTL